MKALGNEMEIIINERFIKFGVVGLTFDNGEQVLVDQPKHKPSQLRLSLPACGGRPVPLGTAAAPVLD